MQKKQFRELSGGLKRRVVLARALVNDPKLLILDEPTAGVDVELRRVLWRYLQEINRDGTTILLTSHYLEEVERLCRDIAIVAKGRIVRQGTKDEIAGAARRSGARLSGGHRRRSRSCGGAMMQDTARAGHQLDRPLHHRAPRSAAHAARADPGLRRALDLGAAVHLHLRLLWWAGAIAHHRRPPLYRIRAAGRADDEHHQCRFLQSSSAIYFSRFLRFIEEMLVSPLSYVEMIVGQPDHRGGALPPSPASASW